MFSYKSIAQIVGAAASSGAPMWKLVLEDQARQAGKRPEALTEEMKARWEVMKSSAAEGLASSDPSPSGLSGGDARRLETARLEGRAVAGGLFSRVIARAVAVNERNACMGRIVAAPTAGACGVLPICSTAVFTSLACW